MFWAGDLPIPINGRYSLHSAELTSIDAVKSTPGLPDSEQKELIEKLIPDPRIKKLLGC